MTLRALPNDRMNRLFEATVEATEEAILNAMVAAETMIGRDSLVVHALPHDRPQEALRKYGRWVDPDSLPRAAAAVPDDIVSLLGSYRGDDPISEARLLRENGMLFIQARGRQRIVPLTDGRLVLLGTGGVELVLDPSVDGRIRIRLGDRIIAELDRIEDETSE